MMKKSKKKNSSLNPNFEQIQRTKKQTRDHEKVGEKNNKIAFPVRKAIHNSLMQGLVCFLCLSQPSFHSKKQR